MGPWYSLACVLPLLAEVHLDGQNRLGLSLVLHLVSVLPLLGVVQLYPMVALPQAIAWVPQSGFLEGFAQERLIAPAHDYGYGAL